MNAAVRKQYLTLRDRPILSLTLTAFGECEEIDRIFLAVPEDDFNFCRKHILPGASLKKEIILVPGGSERQESVYNGLLAVEDKHGIVLIHDGVRPFIRCGQIVACIRGAAEFGACILGIPASDTLKRADGSGYIQQTLEREGIWLAQTPQGFQYDIIFRAHTAARAEGFTGTDDASLVERMGEKVKIINGSRSNIKITTPEDLKLAAAMLSS
jgi:2-C-methyl-D-erythritol 4-phosphate cytidylyltransferase